MKLDIARNRVAIYVPSTRNFDQPLSEEEREELVDRVRRAMNKLFQGTTAINAVGSYNDGKRTVIEQVTIVYSFTDELTSMDETILVCLCKWIGKVYGQHSVGLEIHGGLVYV